MFRYLTVLLVGLLGGCAPAISPAVSREAVVIDFPELAAHPEQNRGRLVILGGEVLSVTVNNGGSLLQVARLPLGDKNRPLDKTAPSGTFWVESDQWLSPGSYVPKRKVTVAGIVQGGKDGSPLLKAQEIHLWEYPPWEKWFYPIPREWYNYDPVMEKWFTPPHFDPWRGGHRD